MTLRAWIAPLLLVSVTACGISEDELKKQLAAQNAKLTAEKDQAVGAEKAAHEKTRKELEAEVRKVQSLEDQLKQMGLRLEEYGVKLQASGSEKKELQGRLDQMNKALAEYKERAKQLEKIKQRFEELKSKLDKLTNLGLKVEIRNNRMVIRLPGDVLFASGRVKLEKKGMEVVKAVSDVIRNDASLAKRYFQVAGHTDGNPLKGGPYKDNWGLSVMRARSVLVYMVTPTDAKDGGGGLDAKYLHAAGYGSTDAVSDNTSRKGRQQNRRVELVVMPDVSEMLDLKTLL